MLTTFVNKNILTTSAQVIAHGVNIQGVMGKGLALTLKNRFPSLYWSYRQEFFSNKLLMGSVHYHVLPIEARTSIKAIANCVNNDLSQFPSANYTSLYNCLALIEEQTEYSSIAMPLIGAGLGGLDPVKVNSLIEEVFLKSEKDVEIYVLSST